MVSASPSDRTSMCTRLAVCARNTAACPAELPPPTTIDLLAAAQLRLDERRAVVDAGAFELRQVRRAAACGTRRRWR